MDNPAKGTNQMAYMYEQVKTATSQAEQRSVLQDWVMTLPLREQGTLLTGIRGCDVTPKFPLDSVERQLVAFLRWCVMWPADFREVDVVGAFYKSSPPEDWKASAIGHYPQHWYAHIMHCFEVIGHRHPDVQIAAWGLQIYVKLATGMHLTPETPSEMEFRLSGDRLATGEIVS